LYFAFVRGGKEEQSNGAGLSTLKFSSSLRSAIRRKREEPEIVFKLLT